MTQSICKSVLFWLPVILVSCLISAPIIYLGTRECSKIVAFDVGNSTLGVQGSYCGEFKW